ncbi:uncharacterized protein LOC108277089 isoform X2 [Ictalurus punctatus]|uniref:Uncharacterized protein LOC108277089 isoform X2 n=1 Tax=Ictalurus punctatus TaxID=7998 RepID=A0A9F7RRW9_ICTPU|nr:uncharacterized protein LOC108277089 isoform X2 [Ictalurus punctatus]
MTPNTTPTRSLPSVSPPEVAGFLGATSGRACDTFPEPCYIRNRKLRSHLVQHAGLGTPYVLMLSPDVKRRVLLTEVCDFPQKSSWST